MSNGKVSHGVVSYPETGPWNEFASIGWVNPVIRPVGYKVNPGGN